MAVWRKIWIKAKENAVVRRRGAEALGILCWLLLSADEQGVVRCSVTDAAERLCISPKILKKILDDFAEDGTLEVESAKKRGTCITLLKWGKYARKDEPEIQTDGGAGNKKEIIGKLSGNYKSLNASEIEKNREIIGKLSGNKTGNKTGETDTSNSRLSSELATIEKAASRARLEEEDIYKNYTTPYARARKENPVERIEKEDSEGCADWMREGFPWWGDWKMPEGMTEKGLDDFFQTQPADEAFRRLYQDGRIFLADIQEGLEERLKDAKDEDDRKEAVRDAKRAAFNLGALDTYAELSKQPQDEFWDKERENDGGYYTMWKLPDFCKAGVDDYETLYSAYNAGTYTGEEAAKRYEQELLPGEFEEAKSELAEAESDGNRFWMGECLDKWRMLKERMDSDECGWGANWWNR